MKICKRLMALALALVMLLLYHGRKGLQERNTARGLPHIIRKCRRWASSPLRFTSGIDLTATITRGEMCELAVVAFEKATGNIIDELERTDYFTDTTDKNILKAHEYGIVSGYPDGSFQPNKTLTRQEFFKIIQNFCEAAAFTAPRRARRTSGSFADSGSIGAWAREAAQLCVSNRLSTARSPALPLSSGPTEGASRQEAMVMFLRAYKDVRQWYNVNITTASVEVNESDLNVTVTDVSKTMYCDRYAECPRFVACPAAQGRHAYDKPGRHRHRPLLERLVPYHNTIGHTAYVSGQYLSNEAGGILGFRRHRPSGSGAATDIANFAMSFVGYSYVWGGMSPSTGFDCSGLMYYVLTQYGYSMKRVANDQMTQGTAISRDSLQVGDLVFFGYGSYANHVGMYIGNGNFVHASTPSTGVRVNSLNETYYNTRYIGARRII